MAYNFEDLSVLIVEDNAPVREITASLMQTFGLKKIATARNAQEGFTKFCNLNPDLVITDWMMLPSDGFEMVRLIRNDSDSPNPYVPVLLMTAFTQKLKIEKARDFGVTEVLAKPFMARDLYKRIVQIIETPRRFVRCDDFFGPDRRRKIDENFDGHYKRETDVRPEDFLAFETKSEFR